jgi:nucleoside-diphosphate-sugar epimerase
VTILVTGGAGLVGSHLLAALRARAERPRALVREHSRAVVEALGAEAIVGDVTDAVTWQRAANGARTIIHAAALVASRASLDEYIRVNVGGTRLAIEAARRAGARLVHISSVAVYGRTAVYAAGEDGVTETFPFQPLPASDFYARSKRAAEQLVLQEARAGGGLSAIAIRPNVIYGTGDQLFTDRVIAVVRRGIVPLIGPATNHLSCVYAGNVASAILAAVDAPAAAGFRAYNVTRDAPPQLSQREFLAAFARAIGREPRFVPIPVFVARMGVTVWGALLRLIQPFRYSGLAGAAIAFVTGENPYSVAKIRRELGWTPPFDTRAAIARTVAGETGGAQNKSPGGARA